MQDLRRDPAGAQLEAGELGAVDDQALDAVPPEAPGAAGAGGAAADDDGVDRYHGAVLAAIDGFRERRDRRDRQAAARRARASRRDFLAFPEPVQKERAISTLGLAQFGGEHPAAKPWKGQWTGVFELVEDHDGATYRTVYTVP